MLATIDFTGSTLTLTLGANEKVVVSNPGENQVRFNVTPYSPAGSGSGGLTVIGGGTLISVGATLTVGGALVAPTAGVTSVTGAPLGFSVVGYATDTTGTLPAAVSLVIKGAGGSAQAVDFQQSSNGAFVTASRISVDLGNDANDDVTFFGPIDRTGVVSGDALRIVGVDDVLVNQPLGFRGGNVVINASATSTSSIGLNAGISATSGDVTLVSRSTIAIKGSIVTAGAVRATTTRNIQVTASITGGSDGVTLRANQQPTPTAESFIGIDVSGATITTTGDGDIALYGRGGVSALQLGGDQHGVAIRASAVVASPGTGTITVFGTGGGAAGLAAASGPSAPTPTLATSDLPNFLTLSESGGYPSSTGISANAVSGSAAFADVSTSTLVISNPNVYVHPPVHGVMLDGDGTKVTSVRGAITIAGQPGSGGEASRGVFVTSGALVESKGAASGAPIRLTGAQVSLAGQKTRVASVSGPILLDGVEVLVGSGAVVESTGANPAATVSINGVGSNVNGRTAVVVRGSGTRVSSVSGPITIAGSGGSSTGSITSDGVVLADGAVVESKGTSDGASITIVGIAGQSTTTNAGVVVVDARVVSAGGPVAIQGKGGSGMAHWNNGVILGHSAVVESTGAVNAGVVSVDGIGGGFGAGMLNSGVLIYRGAQVKSIGAAVEIAGRAGAGDSHGISIAGEEYGGATVSSQTGPVRLSSDSLAIDSAGTVIAKTVTLRPRSFGARIDMGGADGWSEALPTLGLTSSELNRVVAETLTIGAADAGEVSVRAPIALSVPTDVVLRSGAGITYAGGSVNTGGKALVLAPGASSTSVKPLTSGVDATASGVTLESALAITINGPAADTGYSRLKVNGTVNLAGVDLVVNGSYASPGEFVIVEGTTVTGTFNGLPHGSIVTLNGVPLLVTYAADRVILAPPSNVTAGLAGRGLQVTGGIASDSVQILPGPAPRSFVVKGLGLTTVNGRASVVVRNVVSGWSINLGQGNDKLVVGDGASPVTVAGAVQINVGVLGATSQVHLHRLTVSGALTIRSTSGSSEVGLRRVVVGGQFSYAGSVGDDRLTIQASRFRQHARMTFGGGANRVAIASTAFQRTVAINFAQLGVNEIDAGLMSAPVGRSRGNAFATRPGITGPVTRLS